MANPVDIELHAAGAETASGAGDPVDITATTDDTSHPRSGAKLTLEVTAIDAGLTLTVAIETAPSLSGSWRTAASFDPVATALAADRVFAGLRRYVRARWYLSGAGSVTFSLAGQAHTLYCDPADLTKTVINKAALAEVPAEVLATSCLRATSDCESALNSSWTLPLSAWSEDLRGHTAARAVFYSMDSRGFDPESADRMIVMAGGFKTPDGVKSAAQTFFEDVANGRLKPVGVVDATPDEYEGAGEVVSGPRRGWC